MTERVIAARNATRSLYVLLFFLALLFLAVGALISTVSAARADDVFRAGGMQSKLNVTTATVIKAAPGNLVAFTVTTAGAAGTINDITTTAGVAAANLMVPIPATVGVFYIPMPFLNGLVVSPGAGQVVSVSYQ